MTLKEQKRPWYGQHSVNSPRARAWRSFGKASPFILFAVWLFRKSNIPKGQKRPPEKRWRDAACLICGLVMIGSVLWAASSLITHAPIVIPEAIAIFAFAISWLVKGEAYQPVLSRIRKVL